MDDLCEQMGNQIERAREELYQAVNAASDHGMTGPYVLDKSRKLDNLIYRYLLSEKNGKRESGGNGRGP